MNKPLKISLISLGSLLGLVVVVLAVACWLVFTPSKLTKIVNSLSEKYILCDSDFQSVDLTLFKTFPYVGLDVQNAVLVNPVDNAPDTLTRIDNLIVAFNLRDFLKQGAINVRQVKLDGVVANLYVAPDGGSNFDIFPLSETTDTSATTLPETISIEQIQVSHLSGSYRDEQHHMASTFEDVFLDLQGSLNKKLADIDLELKSGKLDFAMRDSLNRPSLQAHLADWILNLDTKADIDLSNLESLKLDDFDLDLKASRLDFSMMDSLSRPSLATHLGNCAIGLDAKGSLDSLDGVVKLSLPEGDFAMGGIDYVTPELKCQGDVLSLKLPLAANLRDKRFTLGKTDLSLAQYDFMLDGNLVLADSAKQRPMSVDMNLKSNSLPIAPLIAALPPSFTQWHKGMEVDGKVSLDLNAKGKIEADTLPLVTGTLALDKGAFAYKSLPMKFNKISAKLHTNLDLSRQNPSTVDVLSLQATSGKSKATVTGKVNDLLGNLSTNLKVKGDLKLKELMPLLPKELKIKAQGDANLDLAVVATLEQLQNVDLNHIKANGNIKFHDLDAYYDSIHAVSPQLDLAVQLPVHRKVKSNEVLAAHIVGGKLDVDMPSSKMTVKTKNPDLWVHLNDVMDKKQKLQTSFDVNMGRTSLTMDSTLVYTDSIDLSGAIRYDETKSNILLQLNPDLDISLYRAVVSMPQLPEAVRMPSFDFVYTPEKCRIKDADIRWGTSDYQLSGTVEHLEDWLDHKGMLTADLNLVSNFADVDQLMNMFSGSGTPKDTLEQQRKEDNVSKEANPFIVPRDVDITFNTHVKRCVAFQNDLTDLSGKVTVDDGVAILDQVGFVCKAARMQLTGIYKSPRPNNLYVGLDFHLLDINIHELIDMIPTIDTLVPMLTSFEGAANFHLAAECNLNAFYQPKLSTLLGAAAIDSRDLVVLDNETFSTIAKYMMFNKKTKNKIDSLDVQLTVIGPEIKVYPFMLSMDKYQVCASGRHTLDNQCNYHLEIIKCPLPLRVGVDVTGNISKPHIKLGERRYTDLYIPEKRDEVEQRTMAIKRRIQGTLQKNVR